jgi:dimethylamine/trimethylamine dehydrogenase
MRDPRDELHHSLLRREADWAGAGLRSLRNIGDSLAPGTVAAAVWSGHRAARELDGPPPEPDAVPFRRERIELHH